MAAAKQQGKAQQALLAGELEKRLMAGAAVPHGRLHRASSVLLGLGERSVEVDLEAEKPRSEIWIFKGLLM